MAPTTVRYAVMLEHYGGFTVFIVENVIAEVLKDTWVDEEVSTDLPTMLSTIVLTVTFHKVTLLLVEVSSRSPFITNLGHIEWIVIFARCTVDFAPMLVILVIAARTHALQTDLKNGAPQRLAQTCSYDFTVTVAGQTLLALVMFFCMECECQEVPPMTTLSLP